MNCLNARSVKALAGVHPDLVNIVSTAMPMCQRNFIVIEGVRSRARQIELYAKGRTTPGPKVTDTMHSRHITGHAVDLAPVEADGSINWNDRAAFDEIYRAMMAAAKLLNIPLRSGMDWDRDGVKREKGEMDSPHYELPASNYP